MGLHQDIKDWLHNYLFVQRGNKDKEDHMDSSEVVKFCKHNDIFQLRGPNLVKAFDAIMHLQMYGLRRISPHRKPRACRCCARINANFLMKSSAWSSALNAKRGPSLCRKSPTRSLSLTGSEKP